MNRSSSGSRPTAIVLGASHWHAPLYRDALARRFHVAAVQDEQPDDVRSFASALGADLTAKVDDALDRDGVDVAFVFSPHHQMPAIAERLIERRTPFVIEKPAATRIEDLRALEEKARLARVPATVALVQRDAPIDAWLRQVGDVVYERMTFVAGPPSRYRTSSPWMLDATLSGGGSLMNLGPHFVDMAIGHIGLPTHVVRRQSSALHHESIDDHSTLVLSTSAGREAIIEVGYAFPDSPLKRYCSFSAAGTNGFASIDTTGSAMFTDRNGVSTTSVFDVDSDPLYDVFVDRVADSLESEFAGMATLGDLVTSMNAIWGPESETDDV